jgi:hypothetical protein
MRRVFAIIGVISTVVFLFTIDQQGKTVFLKLVLSVFAPSKSVEELTQLPKILNDKDFPEDFLIGTASSSYQIEGGWNTEGKSPSIWDDFVHQRTNVVVDNSTGDVGCDSFHNYQEDVAAIKSIGVRKQSLITCDDFFCNFDTKFQHYRFSISWSRIIPHGSKINQNGIDYYAKLIDELIRNDIEPVSFDIGHCQGVS